ncbi:MAG: DUF1080 domain-containing protein [Lacunisphaera sp.]|nr:DUF1080 domain-containing protein [Lacunisphaera sp.]
MKPWRVLLGAAGCVLLMGQTVAAEGQRLTAYERSQGWRYLFDGESLSDWHGYQMNKVPPNWQVVEGVLTSGGGPALVSAEDFSDFELLFDWKVSAGGSAEVYFRANEDGAAPGESGLLMQLAGPGVKMAGNGGLTEPFRDITLQPDVWYRGKIVVFGNQVEHWISGDRMLNYMIDSPDWRTTVAGSGFKDFKGYGLDRAGRIVLAGRSVIFKNIKIKKL